MDRPPQGLSEARRGRSVYPYGTNQVRINFDINLQKVYESGQCKV